MGKSNITENKDVYIVETEFKADKDIKELLKELILNESIETSPEIWYNYPII